MQNILIIEDDEVIQTELKILLKKHGYKVVVMYDFENAIEQTIKYNPHLILLDINIPIYDGYYICREIRKRSKVPIIVVTSRDSDIDELISMNLGADDFITKPYNTQILLARISTILNRVYNTETAQSITFGQLILDIGKSSISYGTSMAELTKNEMRILAMLIKNKDTITPRDDLINDLWQSDEFVDDNTLTVNINRLRKKLDEIGAEGLLKTKRGQGYLLCK